MSPAAAESSWTRALFALAASAQRDAWKGNATFRCRASVLGAPTPLNDARCPPPHRRAFVRLGASCRWQGGVAVLAPGRDSVKRVGALLSGAARDLAKNGTRGAGGRGRMKRVVCFSPTFLFPCRNGGGAACRHRCCAVCGRVCVSSHGDCFEVDGSSRESGVKLVWTRSTERRIAFSISYGRTLKQGGRVCAYR